MGPLLQVALLRTFGLDAGLVTEEPEQHEVRVDLAVHHRFEVELHVGLPREARVVAQDAQAQSVGEEAPEVPLGAVQELLDETVRADPCGASDSGSALVQAGAEAH